MKKIIICDFMEYDDSSNKLGNYHYAKLFANAGYEVLWMSCPYNFLFKMKNNEVYNKRKKLSIPSKHILDKNIYGFAPKSYRLYGNYFGCKSKNLALNFEKYIHPNINESLKKIGFDKVDILWISNPKQYWVSNVVEYKKMITRLPDDYLGIEGFPKSIEEIEKVLIKKSDIVFAISHNLVNNKRLIRKDIKYLPNGVDLSNFVRNKYVKPKEFENKKNKKCIYVGAIQYWFDIDLVKYCAKHLKNIDFYLIGQPNIDLSKLKELDNVFILGKRKYFEIPNYLYYSDVAIIPFKVNDLTNSVSPIKLYEYMSLGLNVVSTDFEEMKYINSPAYIARNKEEFKNSIKEAIDNKNVKELNIKYAMQNTWEFRMNEIKSNL